MRERGEHASAEREKEKEERLFSSSPSTKLGQTFSSLIYQVLDWDEVPPRFILYHPRSTDFEEKIEGL